MNDHFGKKRQMKHPRTTERKSTKTGKKLIVCEKRMLRLAPTPSSSPSLSPRRKIGKHRDFSCGNNNEKMSLLFFLREREFQVGNFPSPPLLLKKKFHPLTCTKKWEKIFLFSETLTMMGDRSYMKYIAAQKTNFKKNLFSPLLFHYLEGRKKRKQLRHISEEKWITNLEIHRRLSGSDLWRCIGSFRALYQRHQQTQSEQLWCSTRTCQNPALLLSSSRCRGGLWGLGSPGQRRDGWWCGWRWWYRGCWTRARAHESPVHASKHGSCQQPVQRPFLGKSQHWSAASQRKKGKGEKRGKEEERPLVWFPVSHLWDLQRAVDITSLPKLLL